MGSQVAMVKGNRQMGPSTHIIWFWLKEVAGWDLRLTKKEEKKREK
jgi:hypothetical protein